MKRFSPAVLWQVGLGLLIAVPAQAQDSLSLRQSIAIALRSNPTLQQAKHARNAALAEAGRTKPRFSPDLQAEVGQIVRAPRLDFPKKAQEVTVLPNQRSLFNLNAKQPLYQFGIGKAPRQRATALEDAAEADYGQARLSLALEVEEAYINALLAQALAKVAVDGVDLAREQVRVTALNVEKGLLAAVENPKAQESLAKAEFAATRARNGTRLALANLNRLLARPVTAPLTLEALSGLPGAPPEVDALLEQAIQQRPDARALRARIDAAQAAVRLAKSARLPHVNAELDYALQTPSAFVPTSQWLAGLSVTMPIFASVADRISVRQAEEGVSQSESGLKALEQGIGLEIEQQRVAYEEGRERKQVAETSISTAREVFRVTLATLAAGHATPAEVDAARLRVTEAEAELQRAIYEMWLADARLRKAMGISPDLE